MNRFILDQYRSFAGNKFWVKVFYIFLGIYAIIISFRGGDIDFFIETGQRFIDHKNLYTETYGTIYFVYSPVFSFLISPFTFLPIVMVRFLWAALNLYFAFEICKITLSYLPQNEFLLKHKSKIIFVSILFTVHFFNLNFMIGQMTVCMLYLCLKSIYENECGNFWVASLLLALGILIKVMPVIILVYLLYNRNIKSFFATVLCIEVLFVLPFVCMPYEVMTFQYASWFDAMVNGGGGFGREYSPSMHSLHSLAIIYFTNHPDVLDQAGILPFNRCWANLPLHQVKAISYSACIVLIGLTLKILSRVPFTESKSKFNTLYEFGYLSLITPLIFPMQQKYGYIFIFPAVIYLLYSMLSIWRGGKKPDFKMYISYSCLILCFMLTSLSTLDFIVGKTMKEISQYYKLIVWGTLILLVPYFMLSPRVVLEKTGQ